MKFHEFDLEAVELDKNNEANGTLRFSFELTGVKNVAKVASLWDMGKGVLETLKSNDVNVLSMISLVSNVYYSFIKKAIK